MTVFYYLSPAHPNVLKDTNKTCEIVKNATVLMKKKIKKSDDEYTLFEDATQKSLKFGDCSCWPFRKQLRLKCSPYKAPLMKRTKEKNQKKLDKINGF